MVLVAICANFQRHTHFFDDYLIKKSCLNFKKGLLSHIDIRWQRMNA
jgi:hypothetical protein